MLTGAAALLFMSGVVATQSVAAGFHYLVEFGRGLIDIARQRIYALCSFNLQYRRYQESYPTPSTASP